MNEEVNTNEVSRDMEKDEEDTKKNDHNDSQIQHKWESRIKKENTKID